MNSTSTQTSTDTTRAISTSTTYQATNANTGTITVRQTNQTKSSLTILLESCIETVSSIFFKTEKPYISACPEDVTAYIFSHIKSLKDFVSLSISCKPFLSISKQPILVPIKVGFHIEAFASHPAPSITPGSFLKQIQGTLKAFPGQDSKVICSDMLAALLRQHPKAFFENLAQQFATPNSPARTELFKKLKRAYKSELYSRKNRREELLDGYYDSNKKAYVKGFIPLVRDALGNANRALEKAQMEFDVQKRKQLTAKFDPKAYESAHNAVLAAETKQNRCQKEYNKLKYELAVLDDQKKYYDVNGTVSHMGRYRKGSLCEAKDKLRRSDSIASVRAQRLADFYTALSEVDLNNPSASVTEILNICEMKIS